MSLVLGVHSPEDVKSNKAALQHHALVVGTIKRQHAEVFS